MQDSAPRFQIGWVALSSFVRSVGCRPASATSPLISAIWCFRAYKPYIFCEDMILATCQYQHIFWCWVEPSLLLSMFLHLLYFLWTICNSFSVALAPFDRNWYPMLLWHTVKAELQPAHRAVHSRLWFVKCVMCICKEIKCWIQNKWCSM